MSVVAIGVNLLIRHPISMNNVYRDSKDLLLVLITWKTSFSGGGTVFYGIKISLLGKRAHVLQHSHG